MRWWLNTSVVVVVSRVTLDQIQLLCKFTRQGPHLSNTSIEISLFKDRPVIVEFLTPSSHLFWVTLIAKLWPVLEQQWL